MLHVRGEMDVHTAPEFSAAVQETLEGLPEGGTLEVDLSEVTFLDCSGVSALLSARRHAIGRGGRMVLVQVPTNVQKLLRLTGVEAVFDPDRPTVVVLPHSDEERLPLSN